MEWKYEYQSPLNNGSKKYDVSLTGQYISNNSEVEWKMTVNEQGSSAKFYGHEGIVSVNHTGGSFTVNKDALNPMPYMTIEFTRKVADHDITIRFSNVLAGDEGEGDYIEWRTQNGETYDRGYNVWNKESLLEIEANDILKNGRVKHPMHFGDEEWHCWDNNQVNIDC